MEKFCCFDPACSSVAGGRSSYSSGKGRSNQGPFKYGFSLIKGKANHPMEDFHVAKFVRVRRHEVGLFVILDGHLGDSVPAFLQKNLFANILNEDDFWTDPSIDLSPEPMKKLIMRCYLMPKIKGTYPRSPPR